MSLIGKSVGNYRVISKIGEGGMGLVYLGEHPLIGKKVAIKVLHAELANKEDIVARFFTEAKAVNDIGHPNIVDIVDFGKMKDDAGQDVVYFVMEYLDGEGLNSRIKREEMTLDDGMNILGQCASALAASHKKNIIHRDLKPENIYLISRGGDRNYCKLLDFGIAKLTGSADAGVSQHKTRTGLVIGTPSYMSPEQCEGKGNVDWRSDIYSLGIVFYEMLTGRVPFPGDGFGEVLVAHLTRPAPLPSSLKAGIPRSLEAICLHAIEKRREDRFQSMDELRAALSDPEGHLATYKMPEGGDAPLEVAPAASGGVSRGTMQRTAAINVRAANPQAGREPSGVQQTQRPTTLSGSAAEVAPAEQTSGGSKIGLLALVALVVIGAGGGTFFVVVKRHEAQLQPIVVTPIPVAAPKEELTVVAIDSTPRGAKIYRAGKAEPIGQTPFELKVKKADADFDVILRLEGYKEELKTVTTQRDHDMLIALTKVEAPAPTPVAATTPPPAEEKHHHHATTTAHTGGGKKGGGDRDGVLEPTF